MKFNGGFTVEAPDTVVYNFITDAKKMSSIIPDVIEFEVLDADNFRLVVKVGLSFIKGKFNLKVRTENKLPNTHAEIHGSGTGSGSSANFHGVCEIKRADDGSSRIDWNVDIEIGGLAASVGSRLVYGASEKYVNQLIESFKRTIAGQKSAVQ